MRAEEKISSEIEKKKKKISLIIMIMNWIEISKWKRREKKEKSDLENGHGFLNFIINILCVCMERSNNGKSYKQKNERTKEKKERTSEPNADEYDNIRVESIWAYCVSDLKVPCMCACLRACVYVLLHIRMHTENRTITLSMISVFLLSPSLLLLLLLRSLAF